MEGRRATFDLDTALAAVLLVVGQFEVWVARTVDGPRGLMAAAMAAMAVGLAWRRRVPVVPPVVIALAFIASMAAFEISDDWPGEPRSAAMLAVWVIAAYSVAAYGGARTALFGLAVVMALAAVRAALDPGIEWEPVNSLFVAIPWGAGRAIRRQRHQAEELRRLARELESEREERARAAVVEERTRIARELHDVVAHSVSVIAVQADAAEAALGRDPERSRAPVAAIKHTARDALVEMRRLLGLLRSDDEADLAPQPGMADLETLVGDARRAGLQVDLVVEGTRRTLPAGLDLSAYRIVQEGLTNVRKHAGAARARVNVRYDGSALEIAVIDNGRGHREGGPPGHGLVGIGERVALLGGTLTVGERPQGGYELRVRLPYGSTSE